MMGGGDFGHQAVAIVGSVFLLFPGFITGAIGLLLQLRFIQGFFGKAAGTVVAAVIRQVAQRMGKGKMPGAGGFPGGFPGGMPGGFPGAGQQKPSLKADQKQRGKRTFDVKSDD